MYREIVTKAVIGKGKISNSSDVIVSPTNSASKVLGCWIINHYFVSNYDNGKVFAKGRYDVHIWYGFNNDTETVVHKQTVDYFEEFSLNVKSDEVISENNEFVIRCLKYPTCSGLTLNEDGTISVKVNKELSLDIIGEAKLKVQISESNDWSNDEEINNINVNYLNKG